MRFVPESRVRTGLPAGGGGIRGYTFAGDVGFAGPDKGESGKYLLLPPGYQGTVPAAGYFVYRPFTNNVFVFWRAFFSDPTKLAEPVELIERTRIYLLGKEGGAKPMQFPHASNVPVNMLFPSDGSYFQRWADIGERHFFTPLPDMEMPSMPAAGRSGQRMIGSSTREREGVENDRTPVTL